MTSSLLYQIPHHRELELYFFVSLRGSEVSVQKIPLFLRESGGSIREGFFFLVVNTSERFRQPSRPCFLVDFGFDREEAQRPS